MSEGTSLDDLLSDKEPTEDAAIAAIGTVLEAPIEAQPETIGQPRDEHGRFAPNEETGVQAEINEKRDAALDKINTQPVPPTEQTGLPREEFAALKDERRKRQEAEARIASLEAQFQRMQPQPAAEPPANFWDDPDTAIDQRVTGAVSKAVAEQFQRMQEKQQIERIDASEATARSKYQDYDDAFHAFQQAVHASPTLAEQMIRSSDPAEFAYTTGKRALDLERVGSIDELLKAERVKWEQEVRAAAPAPVSFPATTASDGSVGARSGPAWAGPLTLDEMLR